MYFSHLFIFRNLDHILSQLRLRLSQHPPLHLLFLLLFLLSFGVMCAGFRLRPNGVLPGTWKDTRLRKSSDAAFVQRPFTAKMSYVDTRDCMDNQTIHLFDVSLLLLLLMKLEGLETVAEKSSEVEE